MMYCTDCARVYPAASEGDSCGECYRLLMGEPLTRPVPVLRMTYRDDDEAGEGPSERPQS